MLTRSSAQLEHLAKVVSLAERSLDRTVEKILYAAAESTVNHGCVALLIVAIEGFVEVSHIGSVVARVNPFENGRSGIDAAMDLRASPRRRVE